MNSIPKYIAFEGIDGSGKTTQLHAIAEKLFIRDVVAICLAEPTYGPHGRSGRALIRGEEEYSPEEATSLFTADRRDHVERRLGPALEFVSRSEGFIVLQDRYYLSAPAYQGRSRGQMMQLLSTQRAVAPTPDLVLLLDVPVDEALQRIACRPHRSRFENQTALSDIRDRFLVLADEAEERIAVLDGTGTREQVTERILELLGSRCIKHPEKDG